MFELYEEGLSNIFIIWKNLKKNCVPYWSKVFLDVYFWGGTVPKKKVKTCPLFHLKKNSFNCDI